MTSAQKFMFDRDFRDRRAGGDEARARAEEAGYARGLAAGQTLAAGALEARLAASLERLIVLAEAFLAEDSGRAAGAERDAAAFALAFARKIAGEALARQPLAPLEEAARDCFRHLRGVPHLVVRINDLLVEPADALMKRIAHERGFEGRIVVFGEPDIMPGDCRLEWADGGMVRDATEIGTAIALTIGRTLGHGSGAA